MIYQKITLPSGIKLETTVKHVGLWERCVEVYGKPYAPDWTCPWCGGHIDHVCDEIDDGIQEDTYSCEGDCDLFITFITPAKYGEYHQVPDEEWTILIENAGSGEWYPPEPEKHPDSYA